MERGGEVSDPLAIALGRCYKDDLFLVKQLGLLHLLPFLYLFNFLMRDSSS